MPADDAIAAIIAELADVRARVAYLERLEKSSYTAHNPVTLDANSVQVNSLTVQELGLQVQVHNFFWGGPTAGAPAIPTFRLLESGDMPGAIFLPLANRITSTSWDGDSYSTTAKTLIDLSAVFATVPAGIKAVLLKVAVNDSGSAAGFCTIILAPHNTADVGLQVSCSGLTNDAQATGCLVVPCDANGDIYYQIYASGASTMDVILEVWGYWAQ